MPFDALTMAAVADEIGALLSGGRIQKVIQPAAYSIGLAVYNLGNRRWILMSADARSARVLMTKGPLAKGFETPSPFTMLLRKHLDGDRIVGVEHRPLERVLVLSTGRLRLVAEIMGKHSNVILIDETDRVLGALKLVPPRESRVRPVLPGRPYQPPPTQDRDTNIFPTGPRLNPYATPKAFLNALQEAEGSTPLRSALLGILAGCGPFLADQIAAQAGIDSSRLLSQTPMASVVEAARYFFAFHTTREWVPTTFADGRGRPDYAAYPPVGMTGMRRATGMSAAIESAGGGTENRHALDTARNTLITEIQRVANAAERRVESLRAGLAATADAESVMQRGQLILTYSYLLEPNHEQLTVPELDITIPLDPLLSPADNAARFFRRYRKLRDARSRIPTLLERAQDEVARLHDLQAFVRLSTSEADLRSLRRDLGPNRLPGQVKKPSPGKTGPRRYTHGPHSAMVGRSARDNEEVTFRLAGRDDLWFHARERTGAHVILRRESGEWSEDLLTAAAALTAYFSEGRDDTHVDVDVAKVRDVKKIPGGPAGRVTYRSSRTIRVEPSIDGWDRA